MVPQGSLNVAHALSFQNVTDFTSSANVGALSPPPSCNCWVLQLKACWPSTEDKRAAGEPGLSQREIFSRWSTASHGPLRKSSSCSGPGGRSSTSIGPSPFLLRNSPAGPGICFALSSTGTFWSSKCWEWWTGSARVGGGTKSRCENAGGSRVGGPMSYLKSESSRISEGSSKSLEVREAEGKSEACCLFSARYSGLGLQTTSRVGGLTIIHEGV